jgi:hypothetical protein
VREENLGALNLYASQPPTPSTTTRSSSGNCSPNTPPSRSSGPTRKPNAAPPWPAATSPAKGELKTKGILMHREALTVAQAFQLMTTASQRSNVRTVELARRVVEQHLATLDHP